MRKIIFIVCCMAFFSCNGLKNGIDNAGKEKPRVIVTTDIQVCCGDPDDIQSLCHLLWYADELDIRAIIPEKFGMGQKPGGITAARRVLDKYEMDYQNPGYHFKDLGFPEPGYFINEALITDSVDAVNKIVQEAKIKGAGPLYVLAWGNLKIINGALQTDPSIASSIRLLTIGTNVRAKSHGGDGTLVNWNSYDRQGVDRKMMVENPAFDHMWWIENDWGYAGMFHGLEKDTTGKITGGAPHEMMMFLAENAGELGAHLQDVVSLERVKWARYFRVGDTPTVLYLIDPGNNFDDPGHGSWAGRFMRPFPEKRPNYWTNESGSLGWNYSNPSRTWHLADTVEVISYQYMLEQRGKMYKELEKKIEKLY